MSGSAVNGLGEILARLWVALVPALALVGLAALSAGSSAVVQQTATLGLIQVVLVLALYIFTGNSGIISFGHIGLAAIGGYLVGFFTIATQSKELFLPGLPSFLMNAELAPFAATLLAGLLAGLFGLVTALALMRLSGISASIATFAVLVIVHEIVANWTGITGGSSGMTGIPRTIELGGALLWALAAVAVAFAFQASPTGRRLRASRDDDFAARSVGISVYRERVVAFGLSSGLAGIGGALNAQFLGSFTPEEFYLTLTFLILAMLVVGGMQSLAGAVTGAIVITVVAEILRRFEQGVELGLLTTPDRPGLREVGLALIMLVILIWRPSGIWQGKEVPLPARLRMSTPAPLRDSQAGPTDGGSRPQAKQSTPEEVSR